MAIFYVHGRRERFNSVFFVKNTSLDMGFREIRFKLAANSACLFLWSNVRQRMVEALA